MSEGGFRDHSNKLIALLSKCGVIVEQPDTSEVFIWLWTEIFLRTDARKGQDKGLFGDLMRNGLPRVIYDILSDHRLRSLDADDLAYTYASSTSSNMTPVRLQCRTHALTQAANFEAVYSRPQYGRELHSLWMRSSKC